MQDAYCSGDPYLTFAKQAGAVPSDATKATHGSIRDLYKIVTLATQYGMQSEALATRIGQSESVAADLLRQHRDMYADVLAMVGCGGRFRDGAEFPVHRLRLASHVGPTTTDRTLRNFPMQGNGGECLRLACVYALRRGVKVIAPVHDAVLIESPDDQIDQAVRTTQDAMERPVRPCSADSRYAPTRR